MSMISNPIHIAYAIIILIAFIVLVFEISTGVSELIKSEDHSRYFHGKISNRVIGSVRLGIILTILFAIYNIAF